MPPKRTVERGGEVRELTAKVKRSRRGTYIATNSAKVVPEKPPEEDSPRSSTAPSTQNSEPPHASAVDPKHANLYSDGGDSGSWSQSLEDSDEMRPGQEEYTAERMTGKRKVIATNLFRMRLHLYVLLQRFKLSIKGIFYGSGTSISPPFSAWRVLRPSNAPTGLVPRRRHGAVFLAIPCRFTASTVVGKSTR